MVHWWAVSRQLHSFRYGAPASAACKQREGQSIAGIQAPLRKFDKSPTHRCCSPPLEIMLVWRSTPHQQMGQLGHQLLHHGLPIEGMDENKLHDGVWPCCKAEVTATCR